MDIQPIPYGRKTATKVSLAWGAKLFFDENVNLIVTLLSEDDEALDEIHNPMTIENYISQGNSKESRADALLFSLGILKQL